MYNRRNYMVDIETLDTKPGAAILSIGAVEFDITGVLANEFSVNINLLDSLFNGFTISEDTLTWWRNQNANARRALTYDIITKTVAEALAAFGNWLPSCNDDFFLWAKGPDFDIVLLDHAYRKMGFQKLPWSYRNVRDVRTILWAARQVQPEATVEHDAVADAIAQAKGVALALQKIQDGPIKRLPA